MLKLITHVNNEIYWLKCPDCSTFVVVDRNHPKAHEFNQRECPCCADMRPEEYPFKFITKDAADSNPHIRDSLEWLENIETM